MKQDTLKKFILKQTEKGLSNEEIAKALEKRGHVNNRGKFFNTSGISFLKNKFKQTPKKTYSKSASKMISIPIHETPTKLVALMGSPNDVMKAISQIGGF